MPVSRAMKAVGYSNKTAKDPSMLTKSRAWLQVVEKNGITLDNVSQVHAKLLHSKREEIQQRAVDTAYKVHGVYDHTRSSTTAIPIQINIIPPDSGLKYRDMEGGGIAHPEDIDDNIPPS